jgi:tetratricopeptide (TPR) repeat protein
MAKDVARQHLNYRDEEDSPAKVLKDVASARTDGKMLLQASRASLAHKDFDKAEKYAHLADKYSSFWTFPVWGDTPSKALKDIAEARKAAGAKTAVAPAPGTKGATAPGANAKATTSATLASAAAKPGDTKPSAVTTDDTAKARALLKSAKVALEAGKIDEAKKLTAQARALKASLGWWEDNPDRMDSAIRAAEDFRKQQGAKSSVASAPAQPVKAPAGKTAQPSTSVPRTKEEARALLEQARKQLADGKLDEAAQMGQRVKAVTSVSWGLFEDSPDRLQIDIEKARVKRDRTESVHLLAEGRKLYEKGDYDNASKLAYKAQKLQPTRPRSCTARTASGTWAIAPPSSSPTSRPLRRRRARRHCRRPPS